MPELIPDSTEVDPEPAAATTLLSDPDGDRPDLDSVVAAAGPGGTVEEWLVPGAPGDPEVPVRIHTADTGPSGNPAARPVVLEIPGGGSALGGATHREAFAFAVARATGAIVVSVGYRLAADDPTAAADDCYAVLEWVASGTACPDMDPDRIVVLGDAAGGALAATVALRAREEGGPCIALQALLDLDLDPGLDAAGSRPHPFGGRDATGQSVPARRIDLTGMPSTYLTVGERAPFRDEATDYARRLRQAGVPVELHCRPSVSGESVLVRDAGATRTLCDAIVRATARTPVLDHD